MDRKKLTPEALAEVIHDPATSFLFCMSDGNPAGMAELDLRKPGTPTSPISG